MGKSMSVEQEWLAHPLSGVELRAMRRLKRDQDPPSPFVFTSERVAPSRRRGGARWWRGWAPRLGLGCTAHPHCCGTPGGFQLANQDTDRRTLQAYLGQSPARFWTDAQRWTANEKLWNWIDAHPEFGIGRPYLDKDPAHVAPIDGKEYVDHRSRAVWRVRAWSRVPSVISQFSSYFAAKITSASVGYARTGELVCCLFFGSFPWTFSTAPQFATLGGRSALRAKN